MRKNAEPSIRSMSHDRSHFADVSPREDVGKANRRLAAGQQIPAVLYGAGLARPCRSRSTVTTSSCSSRTMGGLDVVASRRGHEEAGQRRDPRDAAQPGQGHVLHVDFLAVHVDKPMHATSPVRLVNDPEGVKAGGVLDRQPARDQRRGPARATCPRPSRSTSAALEIGDSLHVSDIAAPPGVTMLDDAEAIVASVQAPRVEDRGGRGRGRRAGAHRRRTSPRRSSPGGVEASLLR